MEQSPGSLSARLRKVLRYIRLYGVGRTYFKVAGRMRKSLLPQLFLRSREQTVCVIGCGQFGFATIGYFLRKQEGNCIVSCFDPDREAAESFAGFFNVPNCAESAAAAISDPRVRLVYVASNHATHTKYAIEALDQGKSVYVEKPVAVSWQQLGELSAAIRGSKKSVFAGYNRPFSAAVHDLKSFCTSVDAPITLSCFVSGHVIEAEHWYRNPGEGTRVCGNIGHWLDLMVHLLSWGEVPDEWRLSLACSNPDARDDDLAITLVSTRGDLVNIVLTARTEPFEGINETINVQWGDCIAKIDDFRTLTVWSKDRVIKRKYWPKDVGHARAILQPWSQHKRDWREVELSSMLMLAVTDMVRSGASAEDFSFSESSSSLAAREK